MSFLKIIIPALFLFFSYEVTASDTEKDLEVNVLTKKERMGSKGVQQFLEHNYGEKFDFSQEEPEGKNTLYKATVDQSKTLSEEMYEKYLKSTVGFWQNMEIGCNIAERCFGTIFAVTTCAGFYYNPTTDDEKDQVRIAGYVVFPVAFVGGAVSWRLAAYAKGRVEKQRKVLDEFIVSKMPRKIKLEDDKAASDS